MLGCQWSRQRPSRDNPHRRRRIRKWPGQPAKAAKRSKEVASSTSVKWLSRERSLRLGLRRERMKLSQCSVCRVRFPALSRLEKRCVNLCALRDARNAESLNTTDGSSTQTGSEICVSHCATRSLRSDHRNFECRWDRLSRYRVDQFSDFELRRRSQLARVQEFQQSRNEAVRLR